MIVNGKNYDWADININIPGLTMELQEISYDDELEKETSYGKGAMARGYGTGNYKSQGKMTMLRDDYNDLLDYCKRKNVPIYKVVLPKIIVSYANDGQKTKSDELNTVTFTKTNHKGGQGDKSLKVDLDFIIVNGIVRDGVKAI